LLLTLANSVWLGLILGILCLRFRDLPQIVGNIVQVAFFISPVIWTRAQIASDHSFLIYLNPFAIFLELLREPLLGRAPDTYYWVSGIVILLAGTALMLPFYGRYRQRISYYV
jgi:ABC-type polysaccharide/polyol phosphate export permease